MLRRVVLGLGIPLVAVTSLILAAEVKREEVEPVPAAHASKVRPQTNASRDENLRESWAQTPVYQTQGGCGWWDPNGNYVGQVITYVPPDTPRSGGYQCEGICAFSEICEKGPDRDAGGGVWTKECSCVFCPDP